VPLGVVVLAAGEVARTLADTAGRPAAGHHGPVPRLLIVEDDDRIRLSLRLALEDEGYTVRDVRRPRRGWPSTAPRRPTSSWST
jgi:PleD family two-component response regulator